MLLKYTCFNALVFQEGEASITVNGETKTLCKDDVILIPSEAKLVAFYLLSCLWAGVGGGVHYCISYMYIVISCPKYYTCGGWTIFFFLQMLKS